MPWLALSTKHNEGWDISHPKARIGSIDLPLRKPVVIVQHDHILGGLAHRVGRVVLDEPKVVRQLQAAGAGAHEHDARVLSLGEQRHEVLDAGCRPGGVGGHGQGDDLAEGPACVVPVA